MRRRRVPDYPWADEPPWGEEALVPIGPPRKPLPSSAVALPLPESETTDVEAIGRDPDEEEPGGHLDARA